MIFLYHYDMTYKHKVQYYETDKQGVTHHSNYIRIMEEARIDAMEQMGFGYERMEAAGIVSPIMDVTCNYKRPTTFADIIEVELSVAELSKLKAKFAYKMTCRGQVVLAIEDRFPAFYEELLKLRDNSL